MKHNIFFYNIILWDILFDDLVFFGCEKIAVLLPKDFSHLISSKYGRQNTEFGGLDLNVGVIEM